jgi:hypothetical protein
MIEMRWGLEDLKMHNYGRLLRAMLEDQLAYLRDPTHPRRLTEWNGYRSLQMAVRATECAQQ